MHSDAGNTKTTSDQVECAYPEPGHHEKIGAHTMAKTKIYEGLVGVTHVGEALGQSRSYGRDLVKRANCPDPAVIIAPTDGTREVRYWAVSELRTFKAKHGGLAEGRVRRPKGWADPALAPKKAEPKPKAEPKAKAPAKPVKAKPEPKAKPAAKVAKAAPAVKAPAKASKPAKAPTAAVPAKPAKVAKAPAAAPAKVAVEKPAKAPAAPKVPTKASRPAKAPTAANPAPVNGKLAPVTAPAVAITAPKIPARPQVTPAPKPGKPSRADQRAQVAAALAEAKAKAAAAGPAPVVEAPVPDGGNGPVTFGGITF